MIGVRDTGLLRPIAAAAMRDSGGVLRTIVGVAGRGADAVLRTVYSALGASVSPSAVFGQASSNATKAIQTQEAAATPQGGSGPYTYAWIRTDGGSDSWSIGSPSSATTRFTANAVDPESDQSATFACTVTDANSNSATSGDVEANASNISSGGGGPLP